ncbi:Crp/Fnr family transcriptional regulator [Flavobacterium cerinum]|uniref:Crp/Fnr family transcriptional regulator n=1 Tax=Flavobacterium cerinum TaxID=2502784 RepID=A0ABY5ITX4_9FLAO|nr:Crp/Fnr family transcriptional regulator [Flavobacterium cerinum]UUC44957.1 Crp/Fnr family transcriptional regulator [Flavobacterium cerinum]
MTQYDLLRQHIAEICPLSDSEWEYVSQHFTFRKLRKHQFLVQKGEMVPCEFWIIKGLVKTYAIDCDGKEHILQFAMEEYWTSDFQAFQNQVPACMYMDCIEDSEFFCLKLEDREKICHEIPSMANFFRIKAHYGYIALQQRIMSLLTETAEERYNNLIKKLPRLIQRVPKKLLASYLGVTRETLSRLKS